MSVSIIIPTLNEEGNLARCLDSILSETKCEIIVADGGSVDKTVAVAKSFSVKVVSCSRGLAYQCNGGAEQAKGERLLFLAADSRLEKGWKEVLDSTPLSTFGGFTLRLDDSSKIYRMIEWGGNQRGKAFQFSLPDQGLFVSREAFFKVGGMPKDSLISFAALCAKLKSEGRFIQLPHLTYSSVRKWKERGILSTAYLHNRIFLKYLIHN